MDKKIKINKDARITVEILKKDRQALLAPTSNQNKGILFGKTDDEYLPRRKKKGILIRDLGYLQGTPNFDLPFVSVPDLENNYANPTRNINQTDYDALNDFLFEFLTPSEYDTTFSQILKTQSNIYDLRIGNGATTEILHDDSEFWKNDKIVVPNNFLSGAKFEITCPNNFFESFNLKGTGRNKITLTMNFGEADYTIFAPSQNMTIYYLPVLNYTFGLADLVVSGTLRKYWFNRNFTVHNRAKYFNPSDALNGFSTDAFWSTVAGNYQNTWQSIAVQKAKLSTRAFYNSFSSPNPVTVPVADFPPNPPYPPYPSAPDTGAGAINLSAGLTKATKANAQIPDEALLAIIKQNNNYFYVWRAKVS